MQNVSEIGESVRSICFPVTQKYISDDFPHNKFVEWKSLPLKVTTNPVLLAMKGMIHDTLFDQTRCERFSTRLHVYPYFIS